MKTRQEKLDLLDQTLLHIMQSWFERVKGGFVTEEDSRELGVEPEVKVFHEKARHRIKFARPSELDVTYGLAVTDDGHLFRIESSVNNKSSGFDFDAFVGKLKSDYWRSRNEKPWMDQDFDRFTYADLLPFEPRLGDSVTLDARKEKADIIRLTFPVNPRHEDLLMDHPEMLSDLIENFCVNPLKRIFAESYREAR